MPQCVEGPGIWRDAFMEPTENRTFHVGDKVAMDWFAGMVPSSDGNQPAMAVTVTMQGTSGASNVTIRTSASLVFSVQHINNAHTKIKYANSFKVDSVVSVYKFRKVDSSPYWNNIDVCGYTHMAWTWPIPESFTVTDGAQYWLTATNVTLFENVLNGTVMASSDKFNILPSNLTTTTTTSTTGTTASTSSATPGPTDSQPPAQGPTTDTGLSAGAKGGIAVGVVLGVALLALIGWFIWRKKQAGGTTTAGERFEKAELGAEAEIPPKETGGNEILEMDAVGAQTIQVSQQLDPAELHGDTMHPVSAPEQATAVQGNAGYREGAEQGAVPGRFYGGGGTRGDIRVEGPGSSVSYVRS